MILAETYVVTFILIGQYVLFNDNLVCTTFHHAKEPINSCIIDLRLYTVSGHVTKYAKKCFI